MGEVQEQSHICKICSKSCANGRSLGGHMRLHVPRKGSFSKAKIDESAYGLRANPKQSWRVSVTKQGIVSCQECGEEFPTSKTLESHVKSHSEMYCCKKCGRGFESIRAMFGHMKTHSKKCGHNSRPNAASVVASVVAVDEDLSGLVANLVPVRRKRSRIKYSLVPSASFSSLNESGLDDEEAEMRMAAVSLIMLSRGVSDWRELSDEDLGFGNDLKVGCDQVFGTKGLIERTDDDDDKAGLELLKCDEDLDFGNELKVGSECSDRVLGTKGLVESSDDDDDDDKASLELLKSDSWKGKSVLGSDSDSESSTGSENDDDDDRFDDLVDEKKRKRYGSIDVISSFYQSVTEAGLKISQLGYSSVDQIEQVELAVLNRGSAAIRGLLDLNFPVIGRH